MKFERMRLSAVRPHGRPRAPDGLRAVVIGGGLAGLAAATVLAERGVRATLVEKEAYLGGRVGSWSDVLFDGTSFEMERGFHGFFRQYYNLRNLLRRIDPELSFLVPLRDYPLFGPNGETQSFEGLPRSAPHNIIELVRRSENLRWTDLRRVSPRQALSMLAYDEHDTYARFDAMTARHYLDSLSFPPAARRMLFDVFSHSFFNPEERYSAAELLMNFHFYFMGNPEGLVFDVMNEPFGRSFVRPLATRLERLGVEVLAGTSVRAVVPGPAGYRVELAGGTALACDLAILALDVAGLRELVRASPELGGERWRSNVLGLTTTDPFVVVRVWLDRPVRSDRAAFAGTAGLGLCDNISVYERFEGESRQWAERNGGSVVELHAYAVPRDKRVLDVRNELVRTLHDLYPETRSATILDERVLAKDDCPAFEPGTYRTRPGVATGARGLAIAGDFVRTPFPTALMERAVSSGFLAANHVLAPYDVCDEPLDSVPLRGRLAALGRLVA
jgi:isorenieratene synthase